MAGMQIFEANGTFTPVTGRRYKIIVAGGGGGGGGARTDGLSARAKGAGGGSGLVNSAIWTAPNANGISVTVGVAGTAGTASVSATANNGGNGGASSFGSVVSAGEEQEAAHQILQGILQLESEAEVIEEERADTKVIPARWLNLYIFPVVGEMVLICLSVI